MLGGYHSNFYPFIQLYFGITRVDFGFQHYFEGILLFYFSHPQIDLPLHHTSANFAG